MILIAEYTYEEYIYLMTVGGCGIEVSVGGNADANIDFLLNEVYQVGICIKPFTSSLTDEKARAFWPYEGAATFSTTTLRITAN